MRNERKVAFQEQRIAELKQRIQELEAENKSMSHELNANQMTLLSKDKTIEKIVKEVEEIKKSYSVNIAELNSMKSNLKDAIIKARAIEKEYTKKASSIIKQMRDQK